MDTVFCSGHKNQTKYEWFSLFTNMMALFVRWYTYTYTSALNRSKDVLKMINKASKKHINLLIFKNHNEKKNKKFKVIINTNHLQSLIKTIPLAILHMLHVIFFSASSKFANVAWWWVDRFHTSCCQTNGLV